MKCAICGAELRGFTDGVMVERREKRGGKTVTVKILVCKDDDACGARRLENERRREQGQ